MVSGPSPSGGPRRRPTVALALVMLAGSGLACGEAKPPRPPPGAPIGPAREPAPVAPVVVVEPAPSAPAPSPAPPSPLPAPRELKVRFDKRITVLPGASGRERVLVYLHGRCGNALAFEAFARAAHEHGTLISFRGDKKCDDPHRSQWSGDIVTLHRRIRAGVEVAARELGLPLERWPVTVVGYSQGATRAEQLARKLPTIYRSVVLIGGPTEPTVGALRQTERTAIVVGSRDARGHLKEALPKLGQAKIPTLYLELPKAGHGEYGPEAERVMGQALDFVCGP
jgi:pimeloyl-ACP methyl ester carboxylesterase